MVLKAYPIFDWRERTLSNSGVVISPAGAFGFVPSMLPGVFRQVITKV
jgi:hypothetical protein